MASVTITVTNDISGGEVTGIPSFPTGDASAPEFTGLPDGSSDSLPESELATESTLNLPSGVSTNGDGTETSAQGITNGSAQDSGSSSLTLPTSGDNTEMHTEVMPAGFTEDSGSVPVDTVDLLPHNMPVTETSAQGITDDSAQDSGSSSLTLPTSGDNTEMHTEVMPAGFTEDSGSVPVDTVDLLPHIMPGTEQPQTNHLAFAQENETSGGSILAASPTAPSSSIPSRRPMASPLIKRHWWRV